MVKGDGILWYVDLDEDESVVSPTSDTSSQQESVVEGDPDVSGKPSSDKRDAVYPGWGIVPDTGKDGGEEGEIYVPPQYTPLPPVPQTEYVTVTKTVSEIITDYSQASLIAYEDSGAYAVRVYEDGYEERVSWSEVTDPREYISAHLEVVDDTARQLVTNVGIAVDNANLRLDAQADQIQNTRDLISDLEGDLDDFKQTADATYAFQEDFDPDTGSYSRLIAASYATKEENVASTKPNLSPFYDNAFDDVKDASNPDGYWSTSLNRTSAPLIEYMGNGWVHVYWDNSAGTGTVRFNHDIRQNNFVKLDTDYTFLFEIRNNRSTGTASTSTFYITATSNRNFYGASVLSVLENTSGDNWNGAGFKLSASGAGKKRVLKKSEPEGSSHWTGDLNGLLQLTFLAAKGDIIDYEVRLSMYEGTYLGEFKPYVPPKTTLATKHELVETAELYQRTLEENYATKGDLQSATVNLATKSEVSQTAQEITQSVSQTYATKGELDAIEVGASNLLRYSGETENYAGYAIADRKWMMQNTYGSYTVANNVFTYTRNSTGLTNKTSGLRLACVTEEGQPANTDANKGKSTNYGAEMSVGDTFSYGVDVKTTGGEIRLIAQYYNGTSVWTEAVRQEFVPVDDAWHRYSCTFTLPSDYICFTALVVACENTEGVTLTAKNYKLERGNRATDWTQSPQDLLTTGAANMTYTTRTDFQQTTDSINLKAEAALRRDPANMLLDWNAIDSNGNPTLARIDAPAHRYWSDAANTTITPSMFIVTDAPEVGIKFGARFVNDGTNTASKLRGLAFYGLAGDLSKTELPYKANQDYTMSVWARCTDGNGAKCKATFSISGSTTNPTPSSVITRLPNYELTSEWALYSTTFKLASLPSDYHRVWFAALFDANAAGTIELCGFKMYPGKNAEAVNSSLSNYVQTSQFNLTTEAITQSISDTLEAATGYADAREAEIRTDVQSITMNVEARTANFPNLTPFFAHPKDDVYDSAANPSGYWRRFSVNDPTTVSVWDEVPDFGMGDAWAHIVADNSTGRSKYAYFYVDSQALQLKPSTDYTFMIEVVNATVSGAVSVQCPTNHGDGGNHDAFGTYSAAPRLETTQSKTYFVVAKTRDSFDSPNAVRGQISIANGASIDAYIRISLYESPVIDGTATAYNGPYKPYVPSQASLYEAHAAIKVNQTNIQSEVIARQDAIKGVTVYENLIKETPQQVTQSAYRAYILDLSENLIKGNKYTLQFWGLEVTRSDKTDTWASIYWGGGSVNLGKITPDENGYGYLTFTAPNNSHANTGNPWLCVYNTPATWESGTTYYMKISKWKLEKGETPTQWSSGPSDNSVEINEVSSRVTQTESSIERLFSNSSAGVDISYYSHTSATSAPSDSVAWQATMPARANGKFIWMRIISKTYKSDSNHTIETKTTKTCISGVDGMPGTTGGRWYTGTGITGTSTTASIFTGSGVASAVVGDMYLNTSTMNTYRCTVAGDANTAKWVYVSNIKGSAGKGISSTTITYAVHSSGTSAPSSGWQTTVPTTTIANPYLWTKTVIAYTDGSASNTSYSVAKQGSDGVGVVSGVVNYAISSSGTSVPSSGWQTTIPSTTTAKPYLWTRTVTSYSDSSSNTSYSVSKQPIDGSNGKGISSITEYYALNNSTTAPADSSFTTGVKTPTSTNRYLWNREKIAYTDGSEIMLDKRIVAIYGEKGANGKGISSITEYYVATNSATSVPDDSAFSTSVAATTSTLKYLWNYEVVSYSDGTSERTDKRVIGTYGDKGDNGSPASTYFVTSSVGSVVKNASGTLNPSSITFYAKTMTGGSSSVSSYSGRFVILESTNGTSWTTKYTSESNESTKRYTISSSSVKFVKCSLRNPSSTSVVFDEQTVPIVVDGVDGKDSYTVILTNESHTFPAGVSAAVASSTTSNILAFKGATQVAAKIGTITGAPTGMTTSISSNETTSAYFTVNAATTLTTRNGTLTIPITVDGKSFTKKFTWSLALKGDAGEDGQMLVAVCSSSATTYNRTASLVSGSLKLAAGATVTVIFDNKYTGSSAMTLNIASTGAKTVRAYNANVTGSSLYRLHENNMAVQFVYDGSYWVVADAAAMHSYVRENTAGLIVGTNYKSGYSFVDNGGGFKVMRKAGQASDSENLSTDISLAEFSDTCRVGKSDSSHVYINSSGISLNKDSTETLASIKADSIRLGSYKEGNKSVLILQDGTTNSGLYVKDYAKTIAKFTPAEMVIGEVADNKRNIRIDNEYIYIRKNTGVYAKFGEDIIFYNGGNRSLRAGIDPNSSSPVISLGYPAENNVKIDSTGVYFLEGSVVQSYFKPQQIVLGKIAAGVQNIYIKNDGTNTTTNASGVYFREHTTILSKFTPTEIILGKVAANNRNLRLSSTAIEFRDNTSVLASFTPSEISLGKNSASSVLRLCGNKFKLAYGLPLFGGNSSTINSINGIEISSSATEITNQTSGTRVPRANLNLSGSGSNMIASLELTGDTANSGILISMMKNTTQGAKIYITGAEYSIGAPSKFREAIGAAASSDSRLKRYQTAIKDEAIDFIRELKPISYWIDDRKEVGLTAQSVAAADRWGTDMVYMTDKGLDEWEKMPDGSKTWKLDYNMIISPLVKAVQVLLDRVDMLEREKDQEE